MELGVLASGNLGLHVLNEIAEQYKINFILTDSHSKNIIQFCNEKDIPSFVGNPRNNNAHGFIAQHSCDVLISINYLFIIEKDLINLPSLFAFNIHGSLLPKYRGRTPHVWAIINNEKETGITAHLIDSTCDTGDILKQKVIPINSDDTGDSILVKFKNNYFSIIDDVLTDAKNNSVIRKKQDETKATYFGKRTPEDGLIIWHWQKERIKNWIRAQSNPYPGAFTFFKGNKIIIDKIEYSQVGFHAETKNGTIISRQPLLVKTPNGVIEVLKIRNYPTDKITKGGKFDYEN